LLDVSFEVVAYLLALCDFSTADFVVLCLEMLVLLLVLPGQVLVPDADKLRSLVSVSISCLLCLVKLSICLVLSNLHL
jgi:hypothetical protein